MGSSEIADIASDLGELLKIVVGLLQGDTSVLSTEGSLAGVTGGEGSSLGGGEGDGAESSVAGSSDLPEQG